MEQNQKLIFIHQIPQQNIYTHLTQQQQQTKTHSQNSLFPSG